MQGYPVDAVGFDSLFLQSGGIRFVPMLSIGPQLRKRDWLCSCACRCCGSHQGEWSLVFDPDGHDGRSPHRQHESWRAGNSHDRRSEGGRGGKRDDACSRVQVRVGGAGCGGEAFSGVRGWFPAGERRLQPDDEARKDGSSSCHFLSSSPSSVSLLGTGSTCV